MRTILILYILHFFAITAQPQGPVNDNFTNAIALPPVIYGMTIEYSGEGATLERSTNCLCLLNRNTGESGRSGGSGLRPHLGPQHLRRNVPPCGCFANP